MLVVVVVVCFWGYNLARNGGNISQGVRGAAMFWIWATTWISCSGARQAGRPRAAGAGKGAGTAVYNGVGRLLGLFVWLGLTRFGSVRYFALCFALQWRFNVRFAGWFGSRRKTRTSDMVGGGYC